MSQRAFVVLLGVSLWLGAGAVIAPRGHAQTWSDARKRPALFQIIAVDATGESIWPYGSEDIAGDGARFDSLEQQLDLRTTYASADSNRLWLRSYVSATSALPKTAIVFYYFDTDFDLRTGGSAAASEVWPMFATDPSGGGYEQVIAIRGDGTLVAHYRFSESTRKFVAQTDPAPAISVEFGTDRDPIGIGASNHGYAQFGITHAVSGLDSNCRTQIFVRVWNDVPKSPFGDDALVRADCVVHENVFGDPDVLHSDVCNADTDCPASGHCREHVCIFAYACETNADCRADERCDQQICVRTVTGSCTDNSQCEGLRCEAGACVACTETGSRACDSNQLCAPDGRCITPLDATKGPAASGNRNSDDGGVRGGAFHCSAGALRSDGGVASLVWLAGIAFALRARKGAKRKPTRFGRGTREDES